MLQDVRYAVRMLIQSPGFTLVAAISLAIGIGANTAIFSFADAMLLRPLPVLRPGEVVTLSSTTPDMPFSAGAHSYPDYLDFRDQSASFASLVAFSPAQVGLSQSPDALPEYRVAMGVSGNFFRDLGVEPTLGRGFTANDDRPGRDAVAVLGHGAWQRYFAADPAVIGAAIRVNGVECSIIGVAPERFTGMDQYISPHLFIPLAMMQRISSSPNFLQDRGNRALLLKGRLKPGVSRTAAQAEVAGIARNLEKAFPETNRNRTATVRTELQARFERSPPDAFLVSMLMGLVGLVLLISCANVANLLLSRCRARSREIAVRLALGAGRGRLIRQLLTESLLLALAGGAIGLFFADSVVKYLASLPVPTDLPITFSIRLDERVLFYSLLVSIASALVFGLVPALQTSRADLTTALKAGQTNGGRRRRTWGRNLLVIGQVALSLVLLVAASMFYQSFRAVLLHSPGFRTENIVMMAFDPSLVRYSPEKTQEFYRTLVDRARQLPGVRSAALTQVIPLSMNLSAASIVPEGFQLPPGVESANVLSSAIDEQYLETAGIPIVHGRGFTITDNAEAPRAAVVNQTMAARYWPNQDAVGKRLRLGDSKGPFVQIVGVARDSRYIYMGEGPMPFLYLPFAQNRRTRMTLMVHSEGEPGGLVDPLRQLVRSIDPQQPVYDVRTMHDYYQQRGVRILQMILELVGAMGILGSLLAVVGLYGLVAYSVSRRTREIGIRIAIGAARQDVLKMVLQQGLRLAVAGIGIGLAGGIVVAKLLVASFPAMAGLETLAETFVAAPVLLAVTLLASSVPARRAAQVDPNVALRYE
ncbi:MAG: ABC transporter permease [Acidobacteria bacterium]|nr:ABC transporter permease [Acidobacteriota bacterium]